MTLPRMRFTVRRMMVMVVISWTGTAAAQQVTFRLPDDDPNTNSDVVRSAAFSPDGSLLAVGYGRFIGLLQQSRPGQAVVWEARTGKRKVMITGRVDGVPSVAFSPDGKTLAVADYVGGIKLWDVPAGRERLNIEAPAVVGPVAFSSDGKLLAAGLWAGRVEPGPGNDVMIWDAATGKPVRTLKGHTSGVRAVAFSPDGKLLVSGGMDGTARIWETSSGRGRTTLEFPELRKQLGGFPCTVESVAFSPDGRTLATSAGAPVAVGKTEGVGEVTLWSTATDKEVAKLKGYDGMAVCVLFSPDGKLLATAGVDGQVRLWDSATFREIGKTKGSCPLAFSPDGKELVLSVDERTLATRKIADAIQR